MNTLLLDVGGTHTRISISKNRRMFMKPLIVRTPKQFNRGVAQLLRTVNQLTQGQRITAVVAGFPGTYNIKKNYLVHATHLPLWVRKPLRRTLEQTFHAPLTLENDSALVGLGEATYGSGKGKSIVAYLSVSTGVGGVRIVNGHLDRSTFGFEPGHIIIDVNSRDRCTCRQYGDLESLISGTAVRRKYHLHPKLVTDRKVWVNVSRLLATGLVNIAAMWSPEIIVLGGSMFKQPGIIIPEVRRAFHTIRSSVPIPVPIKRGSLGDIGGLYGALALARQLKRKRQLRLNDHGAR